MPARMSQVAEIRRAMEAIENQKKGAGFIAVHPDKGVFLGVDEMHHSVFIPIAQLEPAQPIPVFFHPQYVGTTSTPDPSILDCDVHRVKVTNIADRTVLASDVIDFARGAVRHEAQGQDYDRYTPGGSTIFNRITKSMSRFPMFETRKYKPARILNP